MNWRTSTRSSSNGGECVTVADHAGAVHVRDTKDFNGGELTFTATAWTNFLGALR